MVYSFRKCSVVTFLCMAAFVEVSTKQVMAFQVAQRLPTSSHTTSPCSVRQAQSSLFANSRTNKANTADFDYQELKIQVDAMEKQGVSSSQLQPEKKQELEQYCQRIVRNRPSSIPLRNLEENIQNTKWRMSFSTQAVSKDLPLDATVFLDIGEQGKLDYCLEFSKKTLGLNRLVANSSYTVDSGLQNPGMVTYVYDEIKTDVFGLSGIGVGFFGLLKGRSNYIYTMFFDGKVWIEGGVETTADGGMNEYFNVYTLVEE